MQDLKGKLPLVFFILFISLSSLFVGYIIRDKGIIKSNQIISLDPYKMYQMVNSYRVSHQLPALLLNPKICEYADHRLSETHIDWSHNGYRSNPPTYSKTVGFYSGENLARATTSDQNTVVAWIKSPEHLANIVNSKFTQTCVVSDSVGAETYTVQEFSSNF